MAREVYTEWGPEVEWFKARDGQLLTFLDGVDNSRSVKLPLARVGEC